MNTQAKKIVFTTIIALTVVTGISCETDVDNDAEMTVAKSSFPIKDGRVRELVGSDTIERRSESFSVKSQSLPKIRFAKYTQQESQDSLIKNANFMLNGKAQLKSVIDSGKSISIKTGDGVAWAAQTSGAYSIKNHNKKIGRTVVIDAEDAVNRALEQVADMEVLKMAKNETLDVVAVNATYNATWTEVDGEIQAAVFLDKYGKNPVTQYKSEYTVYFGRKYKGVPIIGPSLGVRLDSSGKMVALMKNWRDILGEDDTYVDILSPTQIENSKNSRFSKSHEVQSMKCGYVEANAYGYEQTTPGIGCQLIHHDETKAGTLNEEAEEWINISTEKNLSLTGKKVEIE